MSPIILRNLIVNITSAEPEQFKAKLDTLHLFPKYFDGGECTLGAGFQILSQRYYYYDVPTEHLAAMLRHIHTESEGVVYQIKINPQGQGNHNFD